VLPWAARKRACPLTDAAGGFARRFCCSVARVCEPDGGRLAQYGFGGLSIGSEFLRVKHRDRVPALTSVAFVHCKALNAPAHLGADHN